MSDYKTNRQYADYWSNEICRILRTQLGKIIEIKPASYDYDVKKATDFIIKISSGGSVAARVRRPGYKSFGDITIRSYNDGYPTELEKLLSPESANWYFYAWAKDERNLEDWVLIDLEKARKAWILDRDWEEKPNKNGKTKFIIIPLDVFRRYDCVISEKNEIFF